MSLKKIIIELGIDNAQFVDGLSKAERQMFTAAGKISKSMTQAERSARTFERAIERQEKDLKSLRMSIDPVYAATQRYEKAQQQVAKAVAYGSLTQKKANEVLAQARSAYGIAAVEVGRFGKMTGQTRNAIQNTSYQISDMAVQLEMGTDPMRVMAQQLPQLAAGFGAVGAVVGTVAAIGIPLASMLMDSSDAADKAGESVDNLASSLSAARGAFELAIGDAEGLERAYGEVSESARKTALSEANNKLRDAISGTETILESILSDKAVAEIKSYQEGLEWVEKKIQDIQVEIAEVGSTPSLENSLKKWETALNSTEIRLLELANQFEVSRDSIDSFYGLITRSQEQINENDYAGLKESLLELQDLKLSIGNDAFESLLGQLTESTGEVINLTNLLEDFNEVADELDSSSLDSIASALSDSEREIVNAVGGMGEWIQLTDDQRAVLSTIPPEIIEAAKELGITNEGVLNGIELAESLASSFGHAADSAYGVADAADTISSAISGAIEQANALVSALGSAKNAYQVAKINNEFRADPVAKAGALAGLNFDNKFGEAEGIRGLVLNGAKAIVTASAEATAALNEETKAANEADRALRNKSRGGRGGGRGRSGRSAVNNAAREIERQEKAFERLAAQLDPVNAGMEKYREQLDLINNMAKSAEERESMTKSLVENQVESLIGSEYSDIESELSKVTSWYEEKTELINAWREKELIDHQTHAEALAEIDRKYSQHRKEALLDGYGTVINTVTGLTKGWVDEQSDAYRAAAAVEKAFALYSVLAKAGPAMAAEWNNPEHTTIFQKIAASAAVGAQFGVFEQLVSSLTPGFENGGILGGNSYSGDKLLFRGNSGEVILNRGQQANTLMAIANNKQNAGGGKATKIVNVMDAESMYDAIGDTKHEDVITNIFSANPSKFANILGVR